MNRPTMVAPSFGNVFEDILEVLWAPSTVFERSKYRTFGKYMLVLVVVALVITVISTMLTGPWIDGMFDLSMKQAAASGQVVPPERLPMARKVFTGVLYFAPLVVVVVAGFGGGLALLMSSKLVGVGLSYGQAVLIALFASVPRILGQLAVGIQGAVLNGEQARSLYDLSIGPARFQDPAKATPGFMQALAGVDLFNLWQLLILTVGVAVIGRVSKSTGFVAGLVAWAIGTAVNIVPALLRG